MSQEKLEVKIVSSKKEALKVWKMFLIPNIIGALSNGEKIKFKKNILATLTNPKGAFFILSQREKLLALWALGKTILQMADL